MHIQSHYFHYPNRQLLGYRYRGRLFPSNCYLWLLLLWCIDRLLECVEMRKVRGGRRGGGAVDRWQF